MHKLAFFVAFVALSAVLASATGDDEPAQPYTILGYHGAPWVIDPKNPGGNVGFWQTATSQIHDIWVKKDCPKTTFLKFSGTVKKAADQSNPGFRYIATYNIDVIGSDNKKYEGWVDAHIDLFEKKKWVFAGALVSCRGCPDDKFL